MRSKHRSADCLADIIENAERVNDYIAGIDQESFKHTALTRDAVERCLERVCEAVYRMGDQADRYLPGQPCADILGFGNRLRHAYDLPELEASARIALAELEPPD